MQVGKCSLLDGDFLVGGEFGMEWRRILISGNSILPIPPEYNSANLISVLRFKDGNGFG
jgi:hypothetical protein